MEQLIERKKRRRAETGIEEMKVDFDLFEE